MKRWIFWVVPLMAATAQAETVTLESCLEMARATHPQIAMVRAQAGQAGAQREQVAAMNWPKLQLGAEYRWYSHVTEIDIASKLPPGAFPNPPGAIKQGDHDTLNFSLTATQPIFTGFALSAGESAASLRANALERQADAAIAEVETQVATGYYEWRRATLLVQAMESAMAQVEAHEKDVENFLKQGQITMDERLKAKVARLEIQQRLSNARHTESLARLRLALAVGKSEGESKDWQVDVVGEVPAQPQLYEDIQPERAETGALHLGLDALSESRRAAASGYYPTVGAFASANYGQPGMDPFENEWMSFAVLGVQMNWTLWDWGTTGGKVDEQEAVGRETRAKLEGLERQITGEVAAARTGVQEAFDEVAIRREALEAATEQERIAVHLFKQGQKSNTDALDAEEGATRASIELIDAETRYFIAETRLRRALGLPIGQEEAAP